MGAIQHAGGGRRRVHRGLFSGVFDGPGPPRFVIRSCRNFRGDDGTSSSSMIIALATPRVAASVEECLDKIQHSMSDAASRGAAIVCFPEAYLPGLRGMDFDVPPFDHSQQERALRAVAHWARTYRVATILGME